jgi:hypothetical protein
LGAFWSDENENNGTQYEVSSNNIWSHLGYVRCTTLFDICCAPVTVWLLVSVLINAISSTIFSELLATLGDLTQNTLNTEKILTQYLNYTIKWDCKSFIQVLFQHLPGRKRTHFMIWPIGVIPKLCSLEH